MSEAGNSDLPAVSLLLAQGSSFIFVDKILEAGDGYVVAQRYIRPDDPVFRDHFANYPVYPGALLMEMMAQTSSLIARLEALNSPDSVDSVARQPGAIGKVKSLSFLKPARPGDMLTIRSVRGRKFGTLAEFECVIRSGAAKIAAGTLVLSGPAKPL